MKDVSIIITFSKGQPNKSWGTLYIRGYYRRKAVASRSTGYSIEADQWDYNERKVKNSTPNASLINLNLEQQLHAIRGALMQKQIMGGSINVIQIKKAVKGIDEGRDFIQFCRDRVREDYKKSETRRTYRSECSKMEKFRPLITFADVDYSFLNSYKNYMRDQLKNKHNTIWKSLKFISTMINKAIKIGGIIVDNPFDQFDRGTYKQNPKQGIEIEHCDLIKQICLNEVQPATLRKVGMYFLLMAYSGMRFKDAMKFNKSLHVRKDRLIMTYDKFDTNINFQIHTRLAEAIDLVTINPLKISNKEFNVWCKVLGGMIGVDMDLTSHIGRHTMGGLLSDLNVPIEKAQKILGHKDKRSTEIYYHINNKAVDAEIGKMNSL